MTTDVACDMIGPKLLLWSNFDTELILFYGSGKAYIYAYDLILWTKGKVSNYNEIDQK